jgi:hypothetical protein
MGKEGGAQILLYSSYQIARKMNRTTEKRGVSCLEGACTEKLGGVVGETAVVFCSFVGTPVGDALFMLAGGEGDWVDGT